MQKSYLTLNLKVRFFKKNVIFTVFWKGRLQFYVVLLTSIFQNADFYNTFESCLFQNRDFYNESEGSTFILPRVFDVNLPECWFLQWILNTTFSKPIFLQGFLRVDFHFISCLWRRSSRTFYFLRRLGLVRWEVLRESHDLINKKRLLPIARQRRLDVIWSDNGALLQFNRSYLIIGP